MGEGGSDAASQGSAEGRRGQASDPRAGVILPAALLLLLGGTLMAASVLVTARSAVLLSDGDRHLAASLATRSPLASPTGADLPGVQVRALGGGYVLVAAEAPGVSWHVWAVGWRLDGEAVAAGLRAVVETGGGVAGEGGEVRSLDGGGGVEDGEPAECDGGDPLAAVWPYGRVRDPPPDPALPPFPRLGPVGVEALKERAEVVLLPDEGLSGRGGVLVAAAPDAPIEGGWESGLLVASGDIRLGAGARFEGLVLAGGDLVLEDGALVVGAAGVGGDVRFEGGGVILGCREIVRKNLESVEALGPPFPVPGGAFLGRH